MTVSPGGAEGTPTNLVVKFPDPVDGGGGSGSPGEGNPPESPPQEEVGDIHGQWVVNMTGTTYSLENLYITLEAVGTVSIPEEYKKVFEITQSRFNWEKGKPDFGLELQAVLKLGSNQTAIPVKIELSGQVSDTLAEIQGTFVANPQAEALSAYAQRGTFVMKRRST
jgi:hypothetical protein